LIRHAALALLLAATTATAAPICHKPVILAADAGSAAFATPHRDLPVIMARGTIGLSLTNASAETALKTNPTALKTLIQSWSGRPTGTMIGAFYSPALTPHVPPQDYQRGQDAVTATSHVETALKDGLAPFGAELDVTATTLPPDPAHELSDRQLADARLAIADLRHTTHVHTIFPWFTPNDGHYGDFGTNPRFAQQREAAQDAGGLAMDVPGGFWFAMPPAYQTTLISTIHWAQAHHVKTLFAVSPFATGPNPVAQANHDDHLLEKTQAIAHALAAAHARPDLWMVQNYAGEGSTVNRPMPETDPQSLGAVALWLSVHACD